VPGWWLILLQRGPARLLALMSLVDAVGTGLFLAISVVYLTSTVGLSAGQVGAGMSMSAVIGFLTTMPLGLIGDRVGPRRMLIALNLARGFGFASYAILTKPWQYFVVVGFIGISAQAVGALNQALVGTAVGRSESLRTMAAIRALRNVGFGVGASMATIGLSAGSATAYRTLLLLNAGTYLYLAVALRRVRERHTESPAPARERESGPGRWAGAIRDRRYVTFTALNGILSIHMTLLSIGIPLWVIRQTTAPPALIGVLLVVNTMLATLFQVPVSRGATSVHGAVRSLRRAGWSLAGSCLLLAMAASVNGVLVVLLVTAAILAHTAGELLQSAGGWSLSYAWSPPGRQSSYLSLFSLGVAVQRMTGPSIVTRIVEAGDRMAWALLAGVLAACGTAATVLHRRLHGLPRPTGESRSLAPRGLRRRALHATPAGWPGARPGRRGAGPGTSSGGS
jgi:MFS family permease